MRDRYGYEVAAILSGDRGVGFRSDVPSILRALDVSVQPSLSENLGGTIESLLMQCPTVATRVGGMTDSVLNERTGLLANPSDPGSLAEAIVKLLRDPVAARKYGAAGRELMLEKFTLSQTAANFGRIIPALL
jgi:glycosyltransferase involved in cell wall biosynthesis